MNFLQKSSSENPYPILQNSLSIPKMILNNILWSILQIVDLYSSFVFFQKKKREKESKYIFVVYYNNGKINIKTNGLNLGRVGKPRQRALTAILPPELRQKKLDVA